MTHAEQQCPCVSAHGGSGHYVFLAAEGGHHRRSNYAWRVFRPAVDGRHRPTTKDQSGRLVIADTTQWPGIPAAAWSPAEPGVDFNPPRGQGIRKLAAATPRSCWLVIRPGLTPHGLRHSHKTWMTEDGIPEIVQALRLGHHPRHARRLHPRLRHHARRPQAGPASPLGSLPARAQRSPRTPPSRCWTDCWSPTAPPGRR
jgi:hypothetical protein